MKILHVGGYHSLTLTLARYQWRRGHDASVWGSDERDYDFERPFVCIQGTQKLLEVVNERFDIVHVHGLDALLQSGDEPETVLAGMKRTGASLVFSHYGHDGRVSDKVAVSSSVETDSSLWSYFDHLFLCNFDGLERAQSVSSWSWLPIGIDMSAIPAPPVQDPPVQGVKILHIPYRISDTHTDHIISTVKQFEGRGFKFVFTVVDPTTIESVPALRRLIKDCHLFIEQVERPSFGPLAVDAMAHGKTVLSGNSSQAKSTWEELAMCPVLDTTMESLEKRLESILKEPRCLRDLGRRSRGYAQVHHNADLVNEMVLRMYSTLRQKMATEGSSLNSK